MKKNHNSKHKLKSKTELALDAIEKRVFNLEEQHVRLDNWLGTTNGKLSAQADMLKEYYSPLLLTAFVFILGIVAYLTLDTNMFRNILISFFAFLSMYIVFSIMQGRRVM
jgi:hypothetical protein